MAKAGKLIGEASAIAKKAHQDLSEMDASGELEKAMEKAGWNTSSWHC